MTGAQSGQREPEPAGVDAPGEGTAPREDEACRHWRGHVVVCGLAHVGIRTIAELRLAGSRVVVITDQHPDERLLRSLQRRGVPVIPRSSELGESLTDAGLAGAAAVVCVEASDLQTLETVLLVAEMAPETRIVAQLDNPAVARAVQEASARAAVIDVAGLFSPAVVEACVHRRAHDIELAGEDFVALETIVAEDGTLRDLFGSLVPLGVISSDATAPVVCPGRDLGVSAGDRVTLLGTSDELEAVGLSPQSAVREEVHAARVRLVSQWRRGVARVRGADRALLVALGLAVALLVVSSVILHFLYHDGDHRLSLIHSVYFTVETIATVGFGDYNFSGQSTGLEIFGIVLIVAGTTLVTSIFALLTNALVSRRIAQSLGQARIPGMSGHVVLIGLGSVGMAVLDGLLARGREVVVVERDESNRFLNQVRQRGVPLVLGDATLAQTLDSVNLRHATSVAIVTSDDLTNIETGLAVRDRLGDRWVDVPVILRVFDRELGGRLESSFGFRQVWSTAAIAAPWFVGASLGLDVLSSFYVGSQPFLLARLEVSAGGGLDGLAMSELGAAIRVVAISRAARDGELEHPPRRETRLAAGDGAFIAGPYDELMRILARDRGRPSTSAATGSDTSPPA